MKNDLDTQNLNNKIKVLLFSNSSWYLYNFWLNNIKIFYSYGYEVVLVSREDGYGEKLKQNGLVFYSLNFSRGIIGILNDLFFILRLFFIVIKTKPNIIHNLNPKPVIYGSFIYLLISLFKVNDLKLVVNSFPGLGRLYTNNKFLFLVARNFFELLYRLIASSSKVRSVFQVSADRQYFLQNNILKNNKTYVIPGSGVDIKKFHPSNQIKSSPKRILMASRITNEKGVHIYLSACKKINKIYNDVDLLLAGDIIPIEPDSISYNELINLCTISGVNYLGYVDTMDELLKTIDIVVLPTMRKEGVPRILIESAACGIPLVATDLGGCADIVHHKKNGVIIKKNSVDSLVNAIILLIENDELRKSYGKMSRKNILKDMSADSVSAEYVKIYQEINM